MTAAHRPIKEILEKEKKVCFLHLMNMFYFEGDLMCHITTTKDYFSKLFVVAIFILTYLFNLLVLSLTDQNITKMST